MTPGLFQFEQWRADQIEAAAMEAVQLVTAFRHKVDKQWEPTWVQTLPDKPDSAYSLEAKTSKAGKPYTIKRWCLTDVPKEGGKLGKVQGVAEQWRTMGLDDLVEAPYLRANLAGAGVFWCPNVLAVDAPRRTAEHVTRVAGVFLDLDGAPMPASWPLEPTATVQTSSGRYHIYFATSDLSLEEFGTIQKTLANLYGADPKVSDLPRLMRLPGYYHSKKDLPELVRLTSINPDAQYTRAELLDAWPELGEALAAAESARERQHEDAARRQAEADQLRRQLEDGTAGTRAEVLRKYGQVGLLGCCADLLSAPEGQRNYTLNATAYRAGRLVGAGVLDEVEASSALREVAERIGLEAGEITTSLASGLEAGKEKPIEAAGIGKFVGVKKSKKNGALELARERVEQAPAAAAARYIMPTFPKGVEEGTDAANALILAGNSLCDRLRYTFGVGWYVYDQRRGIWREDDGALTLSSQVAGEVLRAVVADHVAALVKAKARDEELDPAIAWARAVGSNWAIANALKAAAGRPEFLTEVNAWDSRPDLLNCSNGALELTTGTLRPHSPADLLTWQAGAAFDPAARHEYVNQLTDLLKRDGRHDFLQRLTGSTLYGEAPNEIAAVLLGEGGTGKGTLVSAVTAMLGDYAATVDVALLLSNSHGESSTGPKPELLKLRGKRLAVAGEPPKGARFNAGRVKGMTGNDPITARAMRSNILVEFKPVFKLWLHTNYPINAAHDDTGMQRRLRVVPFNAKPERPYAAFKSTLENHPGARSALLNWAYEGFRLWHGQGFDLGMSAEIEAATGGYWKDQNPYEKFAAERLTFRADLTINSARLKTLFEEWTEENGIKMGRGVKMADLHTFLKAQGAEPGRTKQGRFWYGMAEAGDGGDGGDTLTPVKQEIHARMSNLTGVGPSPASPASPISSRDDVSTPVGWEGEPL